MDTTERRMRWQGVLGGLAIGVILGGSAVAAWHWGTNRSPPAPAKAAVTAPANALPAKVPPAAAPPAAALDEPAPAAQPKPCRSTRIDPEDLAVWILAGTAGIAVEAFGGPVVRSIRDAAIIAPQFLVASNDARISSMTSDLLTVRAQMELYKVQHMDRYPAFAAFREQMTGTTDRGGDADGTDFGPYLHRVPTNPFTGTDTIGNGPIGSSAWFYDETTGVFRANDSPEHAGF